MQIHDTQSLNSRDIQNFPRHTDEFSTVRRNCVERYVMYIFKDLSHTFRFLHASILFKQMFLKISLTANKL